jgi:Uma2 family endonuclease
MNLLRARRMSEREFLRLPETMDKVELVDGEVLVTPSPNLNHQLVLSEVFTALKNWSKKSKRPVTVCQSPLDIRFGPERILQPDVFVVLEKLPRSTPMPLGRIPEICVEVLSGHPANDRMLKKVLYAQAGVKEYWIVDPAGSIEQWTGEGLRKGREVERRLTTSLLPGFALDLAEVFEGASPAPRPARKPRRRSKRKA